MSVCGEASSSVRLPVQAPSALFHLGFPCLLCSSGYLASAFCPVVASALGMIGPLVRIEESPCRPLTSSTAVAWQTLRAASANTPSPPKEAGQPQSHQPCLPSHHSAFPGWNGSATCPVWLPVVSYMYSHHRDKHSSNFARSAQIPCDSWM